MFSRKHASTTMKQVNSKMVRCSKSMISSNVKIHHTYNHNQRDCSSLSSEGTPVVPSIVTSSTFKFPTIEDAVNVAFSGGKGHFYTRWSNPTVETTEKYLNKLEHGYGTLLFSSGMQAITSVFLSLLKTGDHIIVPKSFYAGTHEFCHYWLPNYGINVSWIDTSQLDTNKILKDYENKIIQNKTKLIYCETPSNPLNTTIDLSLFKKLGKKYNIITMCDSTFASPFNQLPIRDHQIDIVAHSCTKYLNGHSDVTAGSITCLNESIYTKIIDWRRINGGILGPFDCYLLHRGMKTLGLRVNQINKNAFEIGNWMQNNVSRDIISKVHFVGNKICVNNNNNICQHYLSHCNNLRNINNDTNKDKEWTYGFKPGFGGTFSFELNTNTIFKTKKSVMTALNQLKYISKAVSLGGTETLVEHVTAMTHNDELFDENKHKNKNANKDSQPNYSHGLVRISIGLEPSEMIIDDIYQNIVKPNMEMIEK